MEINQINSINFNQLPNKSLHVDEYLIRGAHPSIADVFRLKKEGVNQIYDLRQKSWRRSRLPEKVACKIVGIDYNPMPFSFLYDKNPTLEDFEKVSKSIKENGDKGGKTFIHCNSGKHRTAQFVAFYEITKGEPLEKCRAIAGENFGKKVMHTVFDQIYNKGYFNRKIKERSPLNLYAKFNNRVAVATKKAHIRFINMLSKGR